MSFFFTKPKNDRAKPPRGAKGAFSSTKATPAAKRQAPMLHRLGCNACPLNLATGITTPKMGADLAPTTLIYFLGEAPTEEQDAKGNFQAGPAGNLLHECIPDDDLEYCSFDNVINCKPPDRDPSWQEQECCRPRRWASIEKAKPKLIVGMGMVPLQWFLGSTDLEGMRGRLFTVKVGNHTCYYMPIYKPGFILSKAFDKKKPLQSKWGHCFKMDLRRAFKLVGALSKPHVDSPVEVRANIQCFDGTGQFNELMSLLEQAAREPLIAVDLETKGLRPFSTGAAVMTAAISYGDVNFSFALDHPKAGWTPAQRKVIGGELEAILRNQNTVKVAHNVPFEMEWFIWLYGKTIADHGGWECTQVQAHFLDERRGRQARGGEDDSHRATYQALDFLCKQHFGIAYKSLFKLDKKDMSKADLGETLIYNGADTKYTLRLFLKQETELKALKIHDAYLDALPRQVTVAVMQTLGIGADQKTVDAFQATLKGEIEGIHVEINDLKVVKAYRADHKGEFNPASPDDAIKIFSEYLNRSEVMVQKPDHEVYDFNKSSASKKKANNNAPAKYSVDKGVLDKIDHPLAALILKLRNKTKLKSTYVDGLKLGEGEHIYPDGLIHCNFNTTFAETGRTSSDAPNMQNFPSRNDSWVRKQVIAGKGHVLLAFDYGQLEACTAAMCSKDAVLVKALWENYDIHAEWAEKLFKRYPLILGTSQSFDDPKIFKKLRSLVKNKLVFPAIFGAQNKSIAGYLLCPEDVIDDLMREFWKTFRGLYAWQSRLMSDYYETGIVSSYVGRPHHYPLTRNQVINHPVQCLAAEIVCNAMNRLSARAIAEERWHIHPRLNIHDDLTFAIPDNDSVIADSIDEIYRVMLTPPYKCLNVPLSVKASVGDNWFDMTEVGQYWSHKDL